MQPFASPWTRYRSRNEWGHTGGADRRLEYEDWEAQRRQSLAEIAEHLIPVLGSIADVLDHSDMPIDTSATVQAEKKLPERVSVTWPPNFQPSHLACGDSGVVATTQDHMGVFFPSLGTGSSLSSPFKLTGMDNFRDILGTSWGTRGLLITSAQGAVAECSGVPDGGVWACHQIEAKLPLGGSSLDAAVVSREQNSDEFRAAIVFKGDSSITLFQMSAGSGNGWIPTGEVQLPMLSSKSAPPALSFTKTDLLAATEGGRVIAWPLDNNGEPAQMAIPAPASMVADLTRHASCGLDADRLGHLFIPHTSEETSLPELYISAVKRSLS
jgi:hypothetical protein